MRECPYRQRVSIACDGDPLYDGLKFLDNGKVLLIKGYVLAKMTSLGAAGANLDEEEEPGPMEIVCCSVAQSSD